MSLSLTKKQRLLLEYIREALAKDGTCPSYEEMAMAMGLGSKSGIHRLVVALEERGHIRRLPNKNRTIALVGNDRPEVNVQPKTVPWKLKIVSVAIRKGNMIISKSAPARHHDVMAGMNFLRVDCIHAEQGFLTNQGTFVNRAEAKRIAMVARQMIKPTNSSHLFSEDLW